MLDLDDPLHVVHAWLVDWWLGLCVVCPRRFDWGCFGSGVYDAVLHVVLLCVPTISLENGLGITATSSGQNVVVICDRKPFSAVFVDPCTK